MKRNCNLELRLLTPSVSSYSSDYNNAGNHHYSMLDISPAPEKQQLTIFYNGKVASCDVTELQARAIILLARREMGDQKPSGSPAAEPGLESPVYSPASGLSMKRSLQRFLQKRKARAQAVSPYYKPSL